MAADEVEDLVADLFGDFSDSEHSGAAGQAAAAGAPGGQAPSSDSEAVNRPKKRRKTAEGGAGRFFELEAAEAGADEDEEEDDLEGLVDDSAADVPVDRAEFHKLQAEVRERDAAGANVRSSGFLDSLEEKYKARGDSKDDGIAVGDIGRSVPSDSRKAKGHQTTFVVPDPASDPRLWCCKTFSPERELCLSLLLKAGGFLSASKPCPIFSSFYNPALRGYIYIEAHKENDIRDFAKGIRGISPWAIRLVPVAQMAQVFSSARTEADKRETLKVGEWVRIKKGLYKGDLAQIEEIQDSDFTVRLKPRLDYSGNLSKNREIVTHAGDRQSRKEDRDAKKRPAARWFNKADVEAAGLMITSARERRFTSKGFLTFFKIEEEVYRDGFLYKRFKEHFFLTKDSTRASEHELQDWAAAPAPSPMTTPDMDLAAKKPEEEERDRKLMPPPAAIPSKASLQQKMPLDVEDIVIVTHGDLMNMRGVVTKASSVGLTVTVRPFASEGVREEALTVSVDRLSKYFEVGDHIKAFAGENIGNSGYIVKVNLLDKAPKWGFGAMATVVTLVGTHAKEWTVMINHARLSVEASTEQDEIGEFKVSDIVKYLESVCIVIALEAGQRALVLDCNGQKQVCSFTELQPIAGTAKGRSKGRMDMHWAKDRLGSRVSVGGFVNARHKTVPRGVKAEVLYINDGNLFLRAVDVLVGDLAYMVVPASTCEFLFTAKDSIELKIKQIQEEKEADKELERQAMEDNPYGTEILMAGETSQLKTWFKKMIGKKDETDKRPYEIGETCRIVGGSYKGLRAEVRDYLGTSVRMSLLAKPKLIVVALSNCQKDDYTPLGHKRWLLEGEKIRRVAAPKAPVEGKEEEPVPIPVVIDEREAIRNDNAGEDYVPVPMTPEAPDAPTIIPPSPGSSDNEGDRAIQALAADKGSSDELFAADAKEWDPELGLEPVVEVTPEEEAAAKKSLANSSWDRNAESEDEMGEAMDTGADDDALMGDMDEDDDSWLMLGLGVLYKEDGTEQQGWVFKVSPDDDMGGSVLVVPNQTCPKAGTVALSGMKRLKESELKPAGVFVKGDTVAVIHGEKRDTKGKVQTTMSLEHLRINTLPIQLQLSANESLEIQKKDLALFSSTWEKAAIAGTTPEEDTDVEMMDQAPAARPALRAPLVATTLRANRAVPEPDPWADDPWADGVVSVADETPQSEENETPTTDAGSSAWGDTPNMSRGPGGTPLPLSVRLRQGRISRLPLAKPLGGGAVTPNPGGFSPTPGGALTPMPGGVTPMLPMPGGVTPMKVHGAITPGLGGPETPGSSTGGFTPMAAEAVPGMVTPLLSGDATPGAYKSGLTTPGLQYFDSPGGKQQIPSTPSDLKRQIPGTPKVQGVKESGGSSSGSAEVWREQKEEGTEWKGKQAPKK